MKTIKKVLAFFLAGLIFTSCVPAEPLVSIGDKEIKNPNNIISEFNLSEIDMNDAYCENALDKEIDYLLSFDVDRLLYNFRKNVGADTKGAETYNGWENSLIGGHTVGHYLTALSQVYANGSVSSSDKEKAYDMLTTIIDELALCQRENGFLWGAKVLEINTEFQFDNVEKGKADLFNEAWVPWYTMHKILEGLYATYVHTGYEPALDILNNLCDWVYNRTQSWDENTHRTVLSIEYGGMNDILYQIYSVTGNEKHAVAAHAFDEDSLFELIRSDGKDVITNRHANTTIPKIIGAIKRYEVCHGKVINGKKVDATEYLETAEIFWQMVLDHHTYATGANSEWEHFGADDYLNNERTNCNCETCNVYNMLKLSKALFKVTGDKKYADYMENAFINDIMASQNPETGMTTYFQSMATGYFKTFSTPYDSFWCCTGSGMENMTKLGEMVYFCDDDSMYVNMFFESSVNWSSKGITLTQSTNLPKTDTTKLSVKTESPVSFSLKIRIPDWAKGDLTIKVNGEAYGYENVNGYAVITREWANKDVVDVTIPLGFTSYNMVDGLNTVAFKYGPVLLAADLGNENMTTTYTGMSVLIPEKSILENDGLNLNDGITGKDVRTNPGEYFERVGDKLEFKFTACDKELTFIPYYQIYDVRYGIYWSLKGEK